MDYFCEQICWQDLSKIAKSCHIEHNSSDFKNRTFTQTTFLTDFEFQSHLCYKLFWPSFLHSYKIPKLLYCSRPRLFTSSTLMGHLFKKCAILGLFFVYFWSFQTNRANFSTNQFWASYTPAPSQHFYLNLIAADPGAGIGLVYFTGFTAFKVRHSRPLLLYFRLFNSYQ